MCWRKCRFEQLLRSCSCESTRRPGAAFSDRGCFTIDVYNGDGGGNVLRSHQPRASRQPSASEARRVTTLTVHRAPLVCRANLRREGRQHDQELPDRQRRSEGARWRSPDRHSTPQRERMSITFNWSDAPGGPPITSGRHRSSTRSAMRRARTYATHDGTVVGRPPMSNSVAPTFRDHGRQVGRHADRPRRRPRWRPARVKPADRRRGNGNPSITCVCEARPAVAPARLRRFRLPDRSRPDASWRPPSSSLCPRPRRRSSARRAMAGC